MTTAARDIGDREQLSATFTDLAGDNADPTTVTLKIRTPDGETATYSSADSPALVTSSATGVWTMDYTYTQEGRHYLEWSGAGALIAAVPTERYVRRSNVS